MIKCFIRLKNSSERYRINSSPHTHVLSLKTYQWDWKYENQTRNWRAVYDKYIPESINSRMIKNSYENSNFKCFYIDFLSSHHGLRSLGISNAPSILFGFYGCWHCQSLSFQCWLLFYCTRTYLHVFTMRLWKYS